MKAAAITVLFLIMIALMSWSREDCDHKLPMVLPLLHGAEPTVYDAAGALAIGIGVAGFVRLARRRRSDREQD